MSLPVDAICHYLFACLGALELQMTVRPNGNAYVATTHFKVPYVAWGLKDPSNFLLHVSHDVDIDVETTAVPAQP
jgi:hypothetical protein